MRLGFRGGRREGPGGFDLVVELKAWDQLRTSGFTAAIPRRGDTHDFGNTLAPAFYKVLDVAARAGSHAWDPAAGDGRVDAHDGDYHDALANKRSTVVLFLVELSGVELSNVKARTLFLVLTLTTEQH